MGAGGPGPLPIAGPEEGRPDSSGSPSQRRTEGEEEQAQGKRRRLLDDLPGSVRKALEELSYYGPYGRGRDSAHARHSPAGVAGRSVLYVEEDAEAPVGPANIFLLETRALREFQEKRVGADGESEELETAAYEVYGGRRELVKKRELKQSSVNAEEPATFREAMGKEWQA